MSKPQASRPFTAILIGGSISGLILAHMFSRAKINFILLEARDTVSPQLGAGITIQANGSRILDQMGLLGPMEHFLTPMGRQWRRKSNGEVVKCMEWPVGIAGRLGYSIGIAERQMLLQSLYEQLEDKSKILVNKKVLSFEHGEDEVKVSCEDGSVYVGNLVVGVDGVHSRTRREMQRIAEEASPGLMAGDMNKVSAEYNAIFGISAASPHLIPGESHISSDIDKSSLMFVSKHGLPQWFFFTKLDKRYYGDDIPRYTKEQMEKQVEENGDFCVTGNMNLRDLIRETTSLSYLSLEEANHEHWSWGRIVCVGDSIHKMTPNLGQGGNQAIESAATLTNTLHTLLTTTPHPTTSQLSAALKKYQDLRTQRSKLFVKLSGVVTRDDALADLRNVLRFLYVPPLEKEKFLDIQTQLYATGPYLEFLPQPERIFGNRSWGLDEQGGVLEKNGKTRARL
ncbi:hypothetical protein HYFRA_00012170 [Hymenoscyphus fraxineus]|uniref:FAD-binding domain-containing protein n=1 Tax=Hymenoscyphus fraxineus TaxID=746836 RepID=A0A9N9L5N4_9HELO|nr:hypothetical protein HYFRA_00012170 [Hymenoscyphus fraxineus]